MSWSQLRNFLNKNLSMNFSGDVEKREKQIDEPNVLTERRSNFDSNRFLIETVDLFVVTFVNDGVFDLNNSVRVIGKFSARIYPNTLTFV